MDPGTDNTSGEDDNVFPIQNLPSLVTQRVVQFLDFATLKRLRLTCQWSKNVVDSPQNIRRLRMILKDKHRLHEVVNSATAWNNFRFIVSDQFPTADDLHHWKTRFSVSTKVLSVKRHTETLPSDMFAQVVTDLMLSCRRVQTVGIEELDFTKIQPESWSKILTNWKHVQHLLIKRVVFISDHTKDYFHEIIQTCSGLQLIILPRIQASSNSVSSVPLGIEDYVFHENSLIEEYETNIVLPIIEKISCEVQWSGKTTLRALFCPEELISSAMYIQLTQLCVKARVVVYHTEPFIIPSHILKVQPKHLYISECIGSISGFSEGLMGQPLGKLKELTINRSNFLFQTDGPYRVPALPNLRSISLHLSTWPSLRRDIENIKRLSAFITSLSTYRPSVKSVFISRFPQNESCSCPHANLLRPYLILSCINITELHLEYMTYIPEEFVIIWKTLRKLEHVRLKCCTGVRDSSIVGSGEQSGTCPMLQLTNLKSLKLDEVGAVTTISYIKVFSQMKLIRLYHTPRAEYPVHEPAFTALLKGVAWNHLEQFSCMGVGFKNIQEKNDFGLKFKNPWVLHSPLDGLGELASAMDGIGTGGSVARNRLHKHGCFCC
ncbi:unnamed protein product [Orchesella dallaii]|uniref:F-box domain-containing protein n=1 Tax=Orchesella dallaii TaxID=48710 RepID=A0ABP1PZ65_9HEXA